MQIQICQVSIRTSKNIFLCCNRDSCVGWNTKDESIYNRKQLVQRKGPHIPPNVDKQGSPIDITMISKVKTRKENNTQFMWLQPGNQAFRW